MPEVDSPGEEHVERHSCIRDANTAQSPTSKTPPWPVRHRRMIIDSIEPPLRHCALTSRPGKAIRGSQTSLHWAVHPPKPSKSLSPETIELRIVAVRISPKFQDSTKRQRNVIVYSRVIRSHSILVQIYKLGTNN